MYFPKIDLQIKKKMLCFFPIWCLENITVPIVIRIGEFTDLNLGERIMPSFNILHVKIKNP